MKFNWQTKKLGEICNISIGKTPPRSDKSFWDSKKETNNIWLSIRDLKNKKGKIIYDSSEYVSDKGANLFKKVSRGTLLASFKLTLGRLAFAGSDLRTNEAIAALKIIDEKKIDSQYLYYFLSYFDWEAATKGDVKIKGKTLNKAKLKKIDIIYPPLPEQKRIVKILDEAFEKLEIAKENAEKNLGNAQELYESYLHEVFSSSDNDWEAHTLGKCFRLKSGENLTRKKMDSSGNIKVYGGNGIVGLHSKSNLKGDNIIIGRVGALCGIVRHITEEIWLTDNAFKVIDCKYEFDNKFLTCLLNYKNLRRLARQAAQPVISNSSLKSLILEFPTSVNKQKKLANKFEKIRNTVNSNKINYKKKINAIDELKKSILQKAFSGEL